MKRGSHQLSAYGRSELARLRKLGGDPLYPAFAEAVTRYFDERSIAWWGGGDGPTASPISSQLSCINHLEPARTDGSVALEIAQSFAPSATAVAEIDRGYLAYEWIGAENYLGEARWSSR